MIANAAWFIDGSYLFKAWQGLKRADKLDYLKLRQYLDRRRFRLVEGPVARGCRPPDHG
jgi:hypothetical protein